MIHVRLTRGMIALVDKGDWAVLSKYAWSYDGRYAVTTIDKEKTYMHNFIVGCPLAGFEVDHRDRDKLNNLRSNLRVVTIAVNKRNKGKRISTASSKYKGVCRMKNGRWQAHIKPPDGKYKKIGAFDNEIEAAMSYDVTSILMWGTDNLINFGPNSLHGRVE